jgi:spore germination protein PF
MPAFISGPIQINTISGNGVVDVGDALVVSPKVASKTAAGSGGFNNAVFDLTVDGINSTNYINPNTVNQPVAGNN